MAPVLSKEPKKEPDSQVISVRVAKVFLARVDRAAKSEGLNRNKTILQLLSYALDAHEKETKLKK